MPADFRRVVLTGIQVLIFVFLPFSGASNAWGSPVCTSCYPDLPPEVTWFGGTVWAADSLRWEAVGDSMWTFDSGVGSSYGQPPYVDPTKDPTFHGYMEGWIGVDLSGGSGGDWSDLKHLNDLPPPLTSCPCAMQDSVLAFADGFGGHNPDQDNIAVSPWIDLYAAGVVGLAGRIIEADYYVELEMLNYVVMQIQAQWTTAQSPTPSPWASITAPPRFRSIECTISGSKGLFDLSAVIPPDAEQVRIALGVVNYCSMSANCTGLSNYTPYFDNVRFGVYNLVDLDTDGDGVSDVTENGGGGGSGDGNGDGTPDRAQRHVASMMEAAGSDYVTISLPAGDPPAGGSVFQCGYSVEAATLASLPGGVSLPCDAFGFSLVGLPHGSTPVTVTITLPPGCTANTYYLFGPTPGNPTPHWYDFTWNGATGAIIYGNTMILTFLDGEHGDDVFTTDHIITVVGGPATAPVDPMGACCIPTPTGTGCDFVTEQACLNAGGTYYGDGTFCGGIASVPINEGNGTIFIHHVFSRLACPAQQGPGITSLADIQPTLPPYYDSWKSDSTQTMCHQFGVGVESPAIPAGFFNPGSDPFTGEVCLKGAPLGGTHGNSDTVIRRSGDPFSPCAFPGADSSTVEIQIVELSLISVTPITVGMNGGTSTENWDVAVDLSSISSPPGPLTATKTYCNGGTYTSSLPVQPRFTFTKVGDPGQVRVLDTGLEGIPPVILDQPDPQSWIVDIGALDDQTQTSYFHPGYDSSVRETDCDADDNGIVDICQSTSVGDDPPAPAPLLGISPNPFHSQAAIQFELPEAADARIVVFDIAGRQVSVLHSGRLPAGPHSVVWDGNDAKGLSVSAGIYVIRVEAGSLVRKGKVMRLQ